MKLIDQMLSERKFRAVLNGKCSKYNYLQNGLLQGFVLSPVIFNVYTADIAKTKSRKFTYADDIALVAQADSFTQLEEILNDLMYVNRYLFYKMVLNTESK